MAASKQREEHSAQQMRDEQFRANRLQVGWPHVAAARDG